MKHGEILCTIRNNKTVYFFSWFWNKFGLLITIWFFPLFFSFQFLLIKKIVLFYLIYNVRDKDLVNVFFSVTKETMFFELARIFYYPNWQLLILLFFSSRSFLHCLWFWCWLVHCMQRPQTIMEQIILKEIYKNFIVKFISL